MPIWATGTWEPRMAVWVSSLSIQSESRLSPTERRRWGRGPLLTVGADTLPRRRARLRPYSSWELPADSSLVSSGYQILGVVVPPFVSCPIYAKKETRGERKSSPRFVTNRGILAPRRLKANSLEFQEVYGTSRRKEGEKDGNRVCDASLSVS